MKEFSLLCQLPALSILISLTFSMLSGPPSDVSLELVHIGNEHVECKEGVAVSSLSYISGCHYLHVTDFVCFTWTKVSLGPSPSHKSGCTDTVVPASS